MQNSQSQALQPALTPRISMPDFEEWLNKRRANELLTPRSYLYCVDGCPSDETARRFAMLEARAQLADHTPEDIARWHKTYGDAYDSDPARFADVVYLLERRRLASYTVLQFMSDVEPKKAEYLVAPYLPLGMLTVLGGVSGVGKTWLALHWAARISHTFKTEEPGAVYYFTQENDPAIVLQPRLEALGADMTRIAIQRMDVETSLTLDDPQLEVAALSVPPRLVIFDPIQSYLGARVEMNKANEVRPILDWLSRFAQRYHCAVVLVSHMSKPGAGNTDALDRLLGSSDFRNAARSIIIVGSDPDDPGVRVFAHAKNSIGVPGPSQRYRVGDDGVQLLGECDLTANEIIKTAARTAGRPASSLNAAVEALRALLEPKGWATYEEVEQMAKEHELALTTIRRAKNALNIQLLRAGKKSWWLLPGVAETKVV